MSKRKLTRRQAWRIQKVQEERAQRAAKHQRQAESQLSEGELGPEQMGLVIAHYGSLVHIESLGEENKGVVRRCHFRANLGSLVTGDHVVWRDGEPNGVVVAVTPRKTELSRPDPYGDMKTVAANIDRIVIVIAPYPEAHNTLIDRYLVAAETLGIEPIILLNKTDLIDDNTKTKLESFEKLYQGLGYQWLNLSTKTGKGIDTLTEILADHTSVFVGQSGVGKSSLINQLIPDQQLATGELSLSNMKGTHTTTTAVLLHFPKGGHLIDSPGIREFGLWHIDGDTLIRGFRELNDKIGHCKFRDCSHQSEPGCAIREAIDKGEVSQLRMASYQFLLSTLDER